MWYEVNVGNRVMIATGQCPPEIGPASNAMFLRLLVPAQGISVIVRI